MNAPSPTCADCGRPLPDIAAICPDCEQRDRVPSPNAGKYLCPGCAAHFDRPGTAFWPLKTPWYLPRRQIPACPHCQAALRDRLQPQVGIGEQIAAVVAFIVAGQLPWQALTLPLLGGAWCLLLLVRWQRARHSVTTPETRYAPMRD